MFRIRPLAPGVWLMRHLRLPTKLGMLAAVLLIPLVVICVWLVQRLGDEIQVADNEANGVVAVSRLADLVSTLQIHRSQAHLLLTGHAEMRDAFDKTGVELRQRLASAEAELQQHGAWDVGVEWSGLKSRIEQLSEIQGISASTAFDRHSAVVDDLRRLVYTLGERSQLLFDPEAATYFLMDMVISRTLVWGESVGQVQALGTELLSRSDPHPDEVGQLLTRLDALADHDPRCPVRHGVRREVWTDRSGGRAGREGKRRFRRIGARGLDHTGHRAGQDLF